VLRVTILLDKKQNLLVPPKRRDSQPDFQIKFGCYSLIVNVLSEFLF